MGQGARARGEDEGRRRGEGGRMTDTIRQKNTRERQLLIQFRIKDVALKYLNTTKEILF